MRLRRIAAGVAVLWAVSCSGAAASARDVWRSAGGADDARRFGLDKPEPQLRRPSPAVRKAAARFNKRAGRAVAVRYGPQGRVAGLSGGLSGPRPGGPHAAATAFFRENRDLLGIDPADISLLRTRQVGGIHHLLYQQSYGGIPVEFSRVKAHLSETGEVLGVDSGYLAPGDWPRAPSVAMEQAAQEVARDLGSPPRSAGTLVYLPVYKTGAVRLAWKFKASGKTGQWYYYVDALTGEVLFRYDDLRYQCQTAGTVTGQIYPLDPTKSAPVPTPIANQYVFVYSQNATVSATTNALGTFCSQSPGKIYAALQGPFASAAHFKASAAHYDNGGGTWFTSATPISSPNPYPNGNQVPNSVVYTATINSPTPPSAQFGAGAVVVKALPIFSFFDVGASGVDSLTGSFDVTDDDQAQILDLNGNPIASYDGARPRFNGAAVQGLNPAMRIRIVANENQQHSGFSISVSSFLVLTNAPTVPALDSSFQWQPAMTADGTLDEVNAFYHINKMHDYFTADIDANGAADISHPALAMVHVGPSFFNAFFNPDFNNLFFGDAANFALDATVVHHEYTHWVVNKIYPIINFGQFGAISEGLADYFSASSLNQPAIGAGIGAVFGSSEGALRNLACNRLTQSPPCKTFPTDWQGEIHDDSLPLSQSLWDLRSAIGQACADELVFQALFYYPDGFQEFLNSVLAVDALSPQLTPNCGAANAMRGSIVNAFAFHGITIGNNGGDAYEPNDGTETATDISTLSVITATIFPTADLDYYTFGAAAGTIHAALTLPANAQNPGTYFAYSMQLLGRELDTLTTVDPPLNVNPTVNGGCPDRTQCLTTAPTLDLFYNNTSPNQFYLLVSASPDDFGDNSYTNSSSPYQLQVAYPRQGSLQAGIVTAAFDKDVIQFTVVSSSFVRYQNYSFDHAVLRDQGLNVLPNTATNGAAPLLVMVSSVAAGGYITGALRLAPGFNDRFPAVGTVYVEVFGVDRLQAAACATGAPGTPCISQSMGLSNGINLTTNRASLTAWNNVLNPRLGQKATFKFETTQPGHVTLRMYTLSGNLVSTLVDEDLPAGKSSADWNGQTGGGASVASGVYLLNMKAPGINQTQKVIVVK